MPPVRLGLMAALPQELQAVLDQMPDEHRETVAGRVFWPGHLQGCEVVAVVSGIGKVAAATTATVLLQRYGVDGIVFTGVAGGLGDGVAVGDVVVASTLLQHDMDASPLFPRHVVPGHGADRWATHAPWTQVLTDAAADVLGALEQHIGAEAMVRHGLLRPRAHQGLVISGDRFVCTSAESQALRQTLPDALAVEMEGAAVAQVCADFGVPFAAVRTISDRADDDAHRDFVTFVQDVASRYSAHMVLASLPRLAQTLHKR
jgi:adenosylhomocysteine nucleosidase